MAESIPRNLSALGDYLKRLVIVAFNLAFLGLFVLVAASQSAQVALWVYVACQTLLYGSHFLFLLSGDSPDLLDALNVLNLGLFLHFTIAPVLLYYGVIPAIYHRLWSFEEIPHGLVLIHLMCVMIQIGYYMAAIPPVRRVPFATSEPSAQRIMIVMLVVFMVAASRGVISDAWRTSGLYIAVWTLAFYLPYVLIIMVSPDAALSMRILAWMGVCGSFVLSLFTGTGSKAGAANMIFAFAMSRNYQKRRLTIRQCVFAASVSISLVLYMNYVRSVGYFSGMSAEAINPFTAENHDLFLIGGVSSTLTPFEGFMTVLQAFPALIPFQNGHRMYEDMVLPLFPRIFFPDKPIAYGAGFVWDELMGFLSSGAKTYESVSLPGYFYIDFGRAGLIICGLLVGFIHGYIYRWLIGRERNAGSIALYGIVTCYTVIAARAFFWTTQAIIVSVLMPLGIIWLCLGRRKASAGTLSNEFSTPRSPVLTSYN